MDKKYIQNCAYLPRLNSRLGHDYTYISKRQSDVTILGGFCFHKTLYQRSFAMIKPSREFPNLPYSMENILV